MTGNRLRLYRMVDRTIAEGPGIRAAIWVQGCSIRCPGCFNPHTWAHRGGELVDPMELGDRIAALPDIEGVTFLGGEPFEQAAAVATVAERARAAGLTVMSFSGTTYEELLARPDEGTRRLLAATDLLADGPYLQAQHDLSRPWIGSKNQRLRALTSRYRDLVDRIEDAARDTADERNRVEVRLAADGSVFVNGMAEPAQLDAIRRLLRQRTS